MAPPAQLRQFTKHKRRPSTEATKAVPGFPMRYRWHTGPWYEIFKRQIELIQSDITRAKAEDKLVVYLGCWISTPRR